MTAAPTPEADCAVWQLNCNLAEVANGVVGDALGALAKAVGDAVGSVLTNLATVWVDVGTPNLTTSGNNPSDAVAFIQDSLWWYMAAAAVLSVMVGGARMAWTMRAEPGKDVLRSLMTLTAVSGAGLAVVALAVEAADRFAEWIIDRSTVGTNFGENLGALLLTPLLTQPPGAGTTQPVLIVILLGLVALISSFVQIVLMIVRSGMLVILAGILPLAASFTTTETGRTWFRRCCAWLIAFILYKPAAAIVYATAFRLAGADLFSGSDDSGVLDVLVGVTMMVLAILALPALMRFVTPAVAVMSGSGGGGAGMAAAAAAIPTGAAFARSGRNGSSGSTGGRGPAGASSTGGGPSTAGSSGAAQVPAQTGGTGAAATGARAAGGGAAGAGTAATAGAAATGVGAVVAAGAMAAQATQRAATDAATRSTGEGS